MLLDTVAQHSEEKKKYLRDLWEKILHDLVQKTSYQRILAFLWRAGIIEIDEQNKLVYLGVPNTFVLSQVKSSFQKPINQSIKELYDPEYKVYFVEYPPFANGDTDFLLDLPQVLNVQETKVSSKAATNPITPTIARQLKEYFGIIFDPRYLFDTFIAGSANELAFAAAQSVATNPGQERNPLFFYGNVGLGKTHLMQAIGNHIIQNHPEKVVVYLPTSRLIDEIITNLRNGRLNNLLRRFDEVDVLLLDDVQFLAGRDRTQEIFHNLFNEFISKNKQIVLTSDRPPRELGWIEARLITRFGSGLVVDIKNPDYETRLAILQSKAAAQWLQIVPEYLAIIAEHIQSNVRELEGSLTSLRTKKDLLQREITEAEVHSTLQDLGYASTPEAISMESAIQQNKKSQKSFAALVTLVAEYYNISEADLKSDSRKKEITSARQMLMYLAKEYFSWTLEKIGDYFGGKNHATAIYAVNNIKKKLKTDPDLKHDFLVFNDWINQ